MSETTPLLTLDGVSSGYGRSRVIHDVSLSVAPGEVVCLLGPNGAGKSTVLKAIASLATVHEGRIWLDGTDITRLPTSRLLERGVAYVPQGRINFAGLTVRENLEMGGFILRDRKQLQARMEEILDRFPTLARKARATGGSLSGGEGQMLAIARGLMMRPRLLLLDEPSLGLAPKTVAGIFETLHGLVSGGMAILVVEQNVHLALKVAARGYLLAGGKIVFDGPSALLQDPERMRRLYLGQGA